jgi:hypothetical protein
MLEALAKVDQPRHGERNVLNEIASQIEPRHIPGSGILKLVKKAKSKFS